MDARTFIIFLLNAPIIVICAYASINFFKLKNVLLGLEWAVIFVSCCFFQFWTIFADVHGPLWPPITFTDAFTRGFGLPVIGVLGFMTLTHRIKPSIRADVFIVTACVLATLLILSHHFLPYREYFLLFTWTVLTLFLYYFSIILWRHGVMDHSVALFVTATAAEVSAVMQDFARIPGNDTNVFLNLWVIALVTWGALFLEMFYAYRALHRVIAERR